MPVLPIYYGETEREVYRKQVVVLSRQCIWKPPLCLQLRTVENSIHIIKVSCRVLYEIKLK